MTSIINSIYTNCELYPDRLALSWVSNLRVQNSITYGELKDRIDQLAEQLQELHIGKGSRVVLFFKPGLNFIVTFLACMKLGAIPVPLKPPLNSQQFPLAAGILADCRPQLVCSSHPAPDFYHEEIPWVELSPDCRVVDINISTSINGGGNLIEEDISVPENIAFLQYTSGSTGAPKGVVVSYDNLSHNLSMLVSFHANCSGPEDSTGLSWLPHFHDMGLIGSYLFQLWFGATGHHMAPGSFFANPNGFLDLVLTFRIRRLVMPNFALEWLIKHYDGRSLDLSCIERIFVSAEPVLPETLSRFFELFSASGLRRSALRPSYGLAESTLIVTSTDTEEWVENGVHVSCGRPHPGSATLLRIVDPDTKNICAENQTGEIWISGPSVTQGYFRKERETKATFENMLTIDGEQHAFCRTGDLGYLSERQLYVNGRHKDMMIIRGENYYPEDIEKMVERSSAVRQGGAVVFEADEIGSTGSGIVILCEAAKRTITPDLESIARKIYRMFSVHVEEICVYLPRAIPKTTSGKLRRQAARELWKQSTVRTLARYRPGEAIQNLAELDSIVASHAYLFQYAPNFNSSATLDELGIESLDLARLGYELEKLYPTIELERFDLNNLYALSLGECYTLLSKTRESASQEIIERLAEDPGNTSSDRIRADAKLALAPTIQAARFGVSQNAILLTGATGFAGAFLLYELLQRTDSEIVLLVRARNSDHARARVEENLRRYELFNREDTLRYRSRISCIAGDLALPMFGLERSQWDELAQTLGEIYHNGAHVNYVASYDQMKPATVDGTRSIIELATECRVKPVHYVSSTIIFGWAKGQVYENDYNQSMSAVEFGYAQSKWAAEQLMRQAHERGLPVRIYRPAMLTASRNAQYSRDDVFGAVLVYFIKHGVYLDIPNQVSLMPVDFFAEQMIDIALLEDTVGDVFHVTMPYANFRQICRAITRQFGYYFRGLSLKEFSDHLSANCKPNDLFFPFVNLYQRHYRDIETMTEKRYVRENYLATRMKYHPQHSDRKLDDVVRYIIEFFLDQELISPINNERVLEETEQLSSTM